ncbi:glutathione S-transferas-like protein [Setomelanomma holmii]|uniref:Glutathione S-transferas-like protein n=1 Tax=Setomelanomma holmii TaxID=210430 RepID=A0A9P4LQC0_9PLEO|nr:glutathione S-transferas-like protein [Setomelanomma holmii]
MSSQVMFYDLANRQNRGWSLNPWKTRLVLNYKNIDYKTEWVEYPNLVPYLKSLGIPPNDSTAPGYFAAYSSPAIKYADGTYGMDSWPIAHELERQYPEPSLRLDNPINARVRDHIAKLRTPLEPHLIPRVPVVFLNPESAEYFYRTREAKYGIPLPELERTKATEDAWEAAKGPAKEVGDWLRENGGPFFLGQTVSYADFIFLGLLHMIKRIDEKYFQRYLELDESFPRFYEASKKWLERDD